MTTVSAKSPSNITHNNPKVKPKNSKILKSYRVKMPLIFDYVLPAMTNGNTLPWLGPIQVHESGFVKMAMNKHCWIYLKIKDVYTIETGECSVLETGV